MLKENISNDIYITVKALRNKIALKIKEITNMPTAN